jgi:hypothetical protein
LLLLFLLLLLLLLTLKFDDLVDAMGDVDDEDDDVDEAEDSGGDVVVVCGRRVVDGDRVRAILAGGGWAAPAAEPKRAAENSSLGPKLGFRMLSMEKGSARRAGKGLLLLMGELTGLGSSGWVSMG